MKLVLSQQLQTYITDERIIVINPLRPSWIVTNPVGIEILSHCDGNHTIDDICNIFVQRHDDESWRGKVSQTIKIAADNYLFDTADPVQPEPSRYLLNQAHLCISSKCNQNCIYCYATDRQEQKAGKLSLSQYKALIDDIKAINPDTAIVLTGGEPMINNDCMDIARYAKSQGLRVDILTNGYFINETNADELASLFTLVTISIDGSSKAQHEATRGPGTYTPTIRAIELLQKHNANLQLSMTVTRLNIDDIPAMAAKYGSLLRFAPLYPAGNARHTDDDITITGPEYYDALYHSDHVRPLGNIESMLANALQSPCRKCSIGDAEISISETGDVYPCHLLHYPEFLMGNIHQQSLSDIYHHSPVGQQCRQMTVEHIDGCRECALRYICGGGCRARSYHENNNIWATSPFCQYEQSAITHGIISIFNHNHIKDNSHATNH